MEDLGGDGWVVDEWWAGGFVGELEGGAEGGADAGGDFFDAAEDEVADGGGVGADGAGEGGGFGDDVAAEAGLDFADGEDGLFGGGDGARDDGLEGGDEVGRDDDGVDGLVGGGGVSAAAGDFDAEGCRGREEGARGEVDHAEGDVGGDVEAEGDFDVGMFEDAIGDAGGGAAGGFFGWLEDEPDGAGELVAMGDGPGGDPEGDGHVCIVAAGVHDAVVAGGEGESALFGHGEGIDIGAPEDAAAG